MAHEPGVQKVEILTADGKPVDSSNPLQVAATFSGTLGAVSQGDQGKATSPWFVRGSDGTTAQTLATESTLSAAKTLLGAGLPASLQGGKLDVNLGTSSITLPISAAALPLPTGAAKDSTLTDGTLRVGGTVAVSAASLPLPSGAATEATLSKLTIAQGAALGTNTTLLDGGSVSTASPSYTTGTVQPLSLSTRGALRVLATGEELSPSTISITARDIGSSTTTGQSSQSIITGTPTANSTATFVLLGVATVRVQVTGTWTGTLQSEVSIDNGTTWNPVGVHLTGTAITTAAFTANGTGNLNCGGATTYRLRATAAWTGTAVVTVVEAAQTSSIYVANAMRIVDGPAAGTSNQVAVKAASTAAAAADPAMVVSLSPNSTTPRLSDLTTSGSITNGQPTLTVTNLAGVGVVAVYVSGSWTGTISFQGSVDGTNFFSMNAWAIGSTAPAVASFAANGQWDVYVSGLVAIRLSGAGISGSATVNVEGSATGGRVRSVQGQPSSVAGSWFTAVTDQTNGPVAVKAASVAPAATDPAFVVVESPNSPLIVAQASTTAGQVGPLIQGAVTTAAPTYTTAKTSPLSLTTAGLLRVSDPGNPTLGSAGSAATTVLTVQGIASMTPVQVSQATASNLLAQVAGNAANGVLVSGNPVLVAGYDGTSTRTLKTDTNGDQLVVGIGTAGSPSGGVLTVQGAPSMTALTVGGVAASGATASGNPVLSGGSDGVNVRTLATDTSGRLRLAGSNYTRIAGTNPVSATLVKSGSGILRRIVNGFPNASQTFGVYDNTSGTSPVIAGVTNPPVGALEYNLAFTTGLIVAPGGTGAFDITVVWE